MRTDAQVVRDALDGLEGGKHWIKHAYYGEGHTRCAIGALELAGAMGTRRVTILRTMTDVIHEQYGLDGLVGTGVAGFNDSLDTKFEDVERVFEKTALRLEEAEACGDESD